MDMIDGGSLDEDDRKKWAALEQRLLVSSDDSRDYRAACALAGMARIFNKLAARQTELQEPRPRNPEDTRSVSYEVTPSRALTFGVLVAVGTMACGVALGVAVQVASASRVSLPSPGVAAVLSNPSALNTLGVCGAELQAEAALSSLHAEGEEGENIKKGYKEYAAVYTEASDRFAASGVPEICQPATDLPSVEVPLSDGTTVPIYAAEVTTYDVATWCDRQDQFLGDDGQAYSDYGKHRIEIGNAMMTQAGVICLPKG